MTTEQWLSRARRCDAEMEGLRRAVDKERERATSITATLGGNAVSGSSDPHKMDNYVAIVNELEDRIKELYETKREIKKTVDKVQNDTLRELLLLRYVSMLSWEEIAVTMHFSYRHVCRLHGAAIAEANKFVQEKMS